jgi:hypothetical protein
MSDLALKIKPPRPKCKRVGRYLYVEFPGGETYVFGVRNARSDTVQCHFQVTPSGCGQYATADGKVGDKPVQYALALDDGKHGTMVAGRWSDDSTWWFWDRRQRHRIRFPVPSHAHNEQGPDRRRPGAASKNSPRAHEVSGTRIPGPVQRRISFTRCRTRPATPCCGNTTFGL